LSTSASDPHPRRPQPAAAEIDGQPVLITGSNDQTVRVCDLATGTLLPTAMSPGGVGGHSVETGLLESCPRYCSLVGGSAQHSPIAEQVRSVLLNAADSMFRKGGFCPVPQIHVLAEDMEQPYLGHIHTRPYYQGQDAAKAISELGMFPTALGATRVLAVWDNLDIYGGAEVIPIDTVALFQLGNPEPGQDADGRTTPGRRAR
jgi:hypothetical protein